MVSPDSQAVSGKRLEGQAQISATNLRPFALSLERQPRWPL